MNKKEYDRQYYQNLSPEQKAKKNSCSKLPEVSDPAKSFGAKTITPRIWEEINKCQLLCYDCHRVKTGIQFSK